MQSLYNKLGPEGRSLVGFTDESSFEHQVPTQLDYLFDELVHPKPSTTPQKVLSYLAYYYPKIKNEGNIELLTYSFLKCPLFFSNLQSLSFMDHYRVLECFKFVMDKKFQVSQPTLPFYKFYNSLFRVLASEALDPANSWKSLPIAVGCLLSVDSRKEYDNYPEMYQLISQIDQKLLDITVAAIESNFRGPMLLDPLYLNVVALACINDKLGQDQLRKVIVVRPDLPRLINDLVVHSNYGLSNGHVFSLTDVFAQCPALNHLSRISFLFCKIVSLHPNTTLLADQLDLILNQMLTLSETVSQLGEPNEQQWVLLRTLLFAQVMLFESVLSRFVHINSQPLAQQLMPTFSRKIMSILFNLNFVVDKIGTGGFEAYNFVYDLCLNSIINYDIPTAELLINCWTSNIQFGKISTSQMDRAKLLFDLQFVENVINLISDDLKFNCIIPIVRNLINTASDQDVLEAAHSVMIKFFTILDSFNEHSTNVNYHANMEKVKTSMLDYLTLALDQFPERLSLNQIGIVVETLTKIAFPNSPLYESEPELSREMLLLLYNRCQVVSNRPLPNSTEFPKTLQSAFLTLLIRVIPLISFTEYEQWLERTFILICRNTNDEKLHLVDKLWDAILATNKYYPQKGYIGINWWYEHVNQEAREKAKL
ncbi:hypothetical protein OGAPHI_007124 [Ogataea philodendri]|uniref:Peroxisomal biogenesis factor 8 n=1 Tax=Ogataea philodendri TaxID=1378263 RepID=A0A9P8NVC2_9ASCO|nr:uncharacterized protein OGAPHI_007124 [Ogataea philodendri]KAH3660538.1 hypothetical protein OGAPHI_007124 [Ogataea philodendri]